MNDDFKFNNNTQCPAKPYVPQTVNGLTKIPAIKALREFTQNTFGVTIGLKEAKDMVDGIFYDRLNVDKQNLRDALNAARNAGITLESVREAVSLAY